MRIRRLIVLMIIVIAACAVFAVVFRLPALQLSKIEGMLNSPLPGSANNVQIESPAFYSSSFFLKLDLPKDDVWQFLTKVCGIPVEKTNLGLASSYHKESWPEWYVPDFEKVSYSGVCYIQSLAFEYFVDSSKAEISTLYLNGGLL